MMRLFDEWQLLPQRFAVHEPSATAVLADVHLGYTAARQRLGDAIPWRTVVEEMQNSLRFLEFASRGRARLAVSFSFDLRGRASEVSGIEPDAAELTRSSLKKGDVLVTLDTTDMRLKELEARKQSGAKSRALNLPQWFFGTRPPSSARMISRAGPDARRAAAC